MRCCLGKCLLERMARFPWEGEGLGWTGMLWLIHSLGRWQGPLLSPASCRPLPGAWIAARWGRKHRMRNARCRAPVRLGVRQDRTFPWVLHAAGIMACRVVGSLAGRWEGGDVPRGECQGRVIPCAEPSLGISGLFSTRLRTLELLACSAMVQAVPPASAPGCSPQRSAAKSNPRPSLRATTKPPNMPITATCARRRLH